MDESTTTTSPADSGAQEAQPVEQQGQQVAENQPVESATTNDDNQEQAAPSDDNLTWLQNKGIDPSDPEAMAKVAKMYRDAERAMHSASQEKAQLQQTLSQPPDPANYTNEQGQVDQVALMQSRIEAMETKQTVDDFFNSNPDAKAYEASMVKIVTESPQMSALVQAGYLTVPQLYQMARGADPSIETKARTEGGREALEQVANKQSGKAVQGQATSSAFGSSEQSDPFRDALLGKLQTK